MHKEYIHIYMGGHHKDETQWRNQFQAQINSNIQHPCEIICIDPFHRDIDESNSNEIVSRDIAILSDPRLNYVLLKSVDRFGSFSTGTASEMIIARSFGKPVIALLQPLDDDEDEWIHPFTLKFSNLVSRNTQEVAGWIVNDLNSSADHGNLDQTIQALTIDYQFPSDQYHPFKDSIK